MHETLYNECRTTNETHSRTNAKTAFLGDAILCRILGKYNLIADHQDLVMMPWLAQDGFWEIWLAKAMARFTKSGDVCLDVGCSYGYFSLILADSVGSNGNVISIDPSIKWTNLLKRTITANHYNQIEVIQAAVSDSDGECFIQGDGYTKLAESGTLCRAITIDSLTKDYARLDFIKMDIDGGESQAWAGMQETIKRFPNLAIMLEYNRSRYKDDSLLSGIIETYLRLRTVNFDGGISDATVEHVNNGDDHNLWLQK